MNLFLRQKLSVDSVLQFLAVIYQGAAGIAVLLSLIFAVRWLRLPFLGTFLEPVMMLNPVGPETGEGWPLHHLRRPREQLIAVNGVPVRSFAEIEKVLRGTVTGEIPTAFGFLPGETIPVTLRQVTGGEIRTLSITLESFSVQDQITYLIIPFSISVFFLILSGWIFVLRRTDPAGRAFALFASSLGLTTGLLFDALTTHVFFPFWVLGIAMTAGALINLAMIFPQEFQPALRYPYLRWMGYVMGFVLAINVYTTLGDLEHPLRHGRAMEWMYLFVGLAGLLYVGINLYYARFASSPVIKSQARTIVLGAILGFGALIVWGITDFLAPRFDLSWRLPFTVWWLVPLVLFPFFLGYTILRFRLIQTDAWMRQGLLYSLLTILVISAYGLLVSGLNLIFEESLEQLSGSHWLLAGLAFLLAISLSPLQRRLQQIVDQTFFRGQQAYLKIQQEFNQKLTHLSSQREIASLLRETLQTTLIPEQVHIYIYEQENDQYVALPGSDGRPTSDLRFSGSGALAQYLQRERIPLYLDMTHLPATFREEEVRLTILKARLFVRLPGKERLLGWVALGPRLSGQPYTPQDMNFVETLCQQAAFSLERLQIVADLERRVQEMNALARVSQGVNITLSLDDVLELIYAQTTQIIPAADLHITLYHPTGRYYYYAFCVENHDRVASKENVPLPPDTGLAQDVIRRGRPLITQDYLRECQTRGLLPAEQGVFAWMAVPLNSGAETIGALSVGSRDPMITYTRGQLDLLQNIADQTTGAIVKSRLLAETERRARQLSMLNEIARQLTSTLETEPLLNRILENAVSILNCEAGSLFLVDEQTEELIFKLAIGPVASELVDKRLPAGVGIVGRVVQTQSPVIDNDVQHSSAHYVTTDQETGFVTRSVLAVPLLVKDRVAGVIEVINRRDGIPFDEDDRDLLMAFAAQAAVALENARLYTLTDQELAARVEELSVMQRIDRELNASLDIQRAMRITLEWAMRQSGAQAGLIGMVEGNDHLRIMAQEGYGTHLSAFADSLMPLDLPALRQAVESGQLQRQTLDPAMGGSLLPEARDQIVVPIRREAQVIGLIVLESTQRASEDVFFLNRLSDHAAIAITNAGLYSEVQMANQAKSEFVSLVAHELKNPMTSIKGYTELLLGGKVGPINEMQTNFLNTIRSNVERMSTLVSDLNDISKIEAGRLRLEFRAVDLNDVLDEVLRSTRRQIEEKRQVVNVHLPEYLPPIWADRTRLAQILVNLVSNANKYTPEEGQIVIGAEATSNRWDVDGADQVVHVWVKDNGIGISPEDQPKIFQKFFRSEDYKAREAPGTGLGLSITKSLVEMQGGRIWFESEFRKGTTFHFTIPIAEG